MRLHELAKELSADSKVLLGLAKELRLGVQSHSSNIPKGAEGILRAAWKEELADMEEQAAKKAKKAQQAAKAEDAETAEQAEKAVKPKPPAESKAPAGSGGPTMTISIGTAPAKPAEAAPEVEPPADDTADEAAPVEATQAADTTDAAAAAKGAPPAEAPPAETEAVAETSGVPGDDTEEPHRMVVTIGGEVALPGQKEKPVAEEGEEADATEAAKTDAPVKKKRERRGAKILGHIELPPSETQRRPAQRGGPSEYDPLDPTRPMPARREVSTEKARHGDDSHRKTGGQRHGKPSESDFVFDPEDNSMLSAIRIGHFAGRRTPTRRPPPRRRSVPGGRRPRRTIARATHPVSVHPPIAVRDLADVLGIKTREILMHFPDRYDSRDKSAIIGEEELIELAVILDREITVLEAETEEQKLLVAEGKRRESMAKGELPRPPVVAVMGHVDHGKTTLLDALRKSSLAAKEAGGITQKTSAYQVTTPSGAYVTVLDTPGHKAFTEMRARGAETTDVAVLVVAADDGVMAQTQEAIDHANAAEVPLVVAINKMDVHGADPRKVRQELASANVLVEDYGGEIGVVEVSALKGTGLDTLVERLALETEILELRADPAVPARGVVIDARKDKDMGIVVTAVIKDGTLRTKDDLLAGTALGRVRYMINDQGKRIKEAGPSTPVQIFGFETAPEAGVELMAVGDANQARLVAKERIERRKQKTSTAAPVDAVTLENLFDTIEQSKVAELNLVLKVDAQGTLDVLKRTIEELAHPEVRYRIIRAGIGAISEDDVVLAAASKAVLIGFGVTPDGKARKEIDRTGVDLKTYDIIYELTDDLEKALEGELVPETKEIVKGHVVIRAIFKSSKLGNIAGCYVTDGTITRESRVRLLRDGRKIYEGKLDSLRRFQDDVKEVKENYECGIHLVKYDDVKVDDVIEAFETIEVARTLDSPSPAKAD